MDNKDNLNKIKDDELAEQMNKQLSSRRALVKILVAIIAFIWFLLGGSAQTVLSLSGGAMGLNGIVSFFLRNPITFFLIGIINVALGLILYFFDLSYLFLIIFHFLWSIRWFYGYIKYRKVKMEL